MDHDDIVDDPGEVVSQLDHADRLITSW